MLVQYYDNIPELMDDDKFNLVTSIWLVRKTALLICISSLLYHYCLHKDELVENYKILQRIENRLDCLQNENTISQTSAISTILQYNNNSNNISICPNLLKFYIFYRIFKETGSKESTKYF